MVYQFAIFYVDQPGNYDQKCQVYKFETFKCQKADDKIYVCKILKNALSNILHIENS